MLIMGCFHVVSLLLTGTEKIIILLNCESQHIGSLNNKSAFNIKS
jgi:hypothetical protein